MLTKIKSSKWAKIRLLFVLPVLVGLLLVFACNQVEKDELSVSETSLKQAEMTADEVYFTVEEMPEFEGGDLALKKFIVENVKYPEQAKINGIQGRVFIQFVVNQKGEIEQVKVVRGVDAALDAEAIRVISLLPKWKPGKQSGKPVRVSFTVPINFELK